MDVWGVGVPPKVAASREDADKLNRLSDFSGNACSCRAFLERHFETVDRLVVLALAVSAFVLGHVVNRDRLLLSLLENNRNAIYGATMGLFGTIFGFGLTSMSIVLAFAESPRLQILRRSQQWVTLWRVFTRGIRTFIVVALMALVAMLFDRDRAPSPFVTYVVMLFVLRGIGRLGRVVWAFEKLIEVMTRDGARTGQTIQKRAADELVMR